MALKNFTTCDCPCHHGAIVRPQVCHVVPCCDTPGKAKMGVNFVRAMLTRVQKYRRRANASS